MSNEDVINLVHQLRNIVVPSCKNVGEQLTYVAYKEKLIDEILCRLQNSPTSNNSTSAPQLIKVDQQKMAEDVIKRTFDAHNRLLRSKLQFALVELEKWKQLSISKIPNAQNLFLRMPNPNDRLTTDSFTQTDIIEREPPEDSAPSDTLENSSHDKLLEMADMWYERTVECLLDYSKRIMETFFCCCESTIRVAAERKRKEKTQKFCGRKGCGTTDYLPSLPLRKARSAALVEPRIMPQIPEGNFAPVGEKSSYLNTTHSMPLNERKNNKKGIMGCGASSDSEELETEKHEQHEILLEDAQKVDMREKTGSVSQILHYPDDSQQMTVLQRMQEQLRNELEAQNDQPTLVSDAVFMNSQPLFQAAQPAARQQVFSSQPTNSLSPQPRCVSPQQRPQSNTAAIIQRQLDLYEQLVRLVQNHQQELLKLRSKRGGPINDGTSTISAPLSHATPANTATAFVPPMSSSTNNRAAPLQSSIPSRQPSLQPPPSLQPQQNSYGLQPPMNEPENMLVDPGVQALEPRQEAYYSGIKEDDSNALARLLKKHFNNFILECEFNATGNTRAFDILRARRCDRLDVDPNFSAGHNLTLERTKHIADLFLKQNGGHSSEWVHFVLIQRQNDEIRCTISGGGCFSAAEVLTPLAENQNISWIPGPCASSRKLSFNLHL
eukprot:gene9091-6384_t